MASLRRLCLCLCLPLLLPPPAAPAPTPAPAPGTDWAACKILSRDLSRLLATVKEPHPVLEEMQLSEEDPQNWPPRILCSDACDPPTLDTNNTRCLHRILQALQHYRDLLGSDIFREQPQPQLETTMDQLLGLVQQEHGHPPRHPMDPSNNWSHGLLRHLALNRLRSFAAVMSRVFTHSAR
ncbi:interleukin-23 subunit alpha [Pipra filicauda]|uniref:Interleukin-23 subunit alpha n=1 Tax=Pipra filicauda TaxID=649802 RepID=A0A7R5L713_9PASS|nr:interleukin-23 subunit alpha [Pipra filicauda]